MSKNPWQVDSIEVFYYLKCPECKFDTQEEVTFQDHAVANHPLSFSLFGKSEITQIISVEPENLIGHQGIFLFWQKKIIDEMVIFTYRVSHSKVGKVSRLW